MQSISSPLTEADVYFQIGLLELELNNVRTRSTRCTLPAPPTQRIAHVLSRPRCCSPPLSVQLGKARYALERAAAAPGGHVKALQLLGWVHHLSDAEADQTRAHELLSSAVGTAPADAFGWYLLGRLYTDRGRLESAYESLNRALYVQRTSGVNVPAARTLTHSHGPLLLGRVAAAEPWTRPTARTGGTLVGCTASPSRCAMNDDVELMSAVDC